MPSSLAEDIRKRQPFDSAEQEAYLNLWRTFTQLSENVDRLMRKHGLCATHYNILRILAGEVVATGQPMPALEVRQRLITRVPDITRLVDKLVRQGLVQRIRTEQDRRVVLLKITDKGQALAHDLAGPIHALHRRELGHLSDKELRQLSRLLEKARTPPAEHR